MAPSTDSDSPDGLELRVERSFTCTVCGYPTRHEAGALEREVRSTCVNCGEWTVQIADGDAVLEAAEEIAGALAGELLTERQLLAFLLREVLSVGRDRTAAIMDSSASNVDNLQRRGREKVEDARRIVAALDAVTETESRDPDDST